MFKTILKTAALTILAGAIGIDPTLSEILIVGYMAFSSLKIEKNEV